MSKQTWSSRQVPTPDQTIRESNATSVRYKLRLTLATRTGNSTGSCPNTSPTKLPKRKSGRARSTSYTTQSPPPAGGRRCSQDRCQELTERTEQWMPFHSCTCFGSTKPNTLFVPIPSFEHMSASFHLIRLPYVDGKNMRSSPTWNAKAHVL